jgi:hypothetical protein
MFRMDLVGNLIDFEIMDSFVVENNYLKAIYN